MGHSVRKVCDLWTFDVKTVLRLYGIQRIDGARLLKSTTFSYRIAELNNWLRDNSLTLRTGLSSIVQCEQLHSYMHPGKWDWDKVPLPRKFDWTIHTGLALGETRGVACIGRTSAISRDEIPFEMQCAIPHHLPLQICKRWMTGFPVSVKIIYVQ